MTTRKSRGGGRPARDVAVRHIGVEFPPAEIADRILAPVDDGRVKTITDRMIALVQLALENEPAIPAQARQEELPMTAEQSPEKAKPPFARQLRGGFRSSYKPPRKEEVCLL